MTTLLTSFVLAHPYVCALALRRRGDRPVWLGVVVIGERQVGVVVKKFARDDAARGQLVALDGEAGLPGGHAGARPALRLLALAVLGAQGAGDGHPAGRDRPGGGRRRRGHSAERILGRVVDCDNFQDARAFLTGGGEKGRQLGLLTAGTYRINTALFDVITAARRRGPRHAPATRCGCTASSPTGSAS